MNDLKPIHLTETVANLIRHHTNVDNAWIDMPTIWRLLQQHDPEDAQRVKNKVKTYKDPQRNNAVWFTYHICYHLGKLNEFDFSNIEEQPDAEVSDNAYGLIRLAK